MPKPTGTPKQPRAGCSRPAPTSSRRNAAVGDGGAYGENHYTGASSATMDKVPQSPMAAALKVSDDGVLAGLVAGGSAKNKTGDLQGQPVRLVRSMHRHSHLPDGAVRQQADLNSIGRPALPQSLSDDESEPDRQP